MAVWKVWFIVFSIPLSNTTNAYSEGTMIIKSKPSIKECYFSSLLDWTMHMGGSQLMDKMKRGIIDKGWTEAQIGLLADESQLW